MGEYTYSLSKIASENEKKPQARERMLSYGITSLSTLELMMILLGSGSAGSPVRKLAGTVLHTVKTADAENLLDKLLNIRGIGEGKACLIAAALELGKRLHSSKGIKIYGPADVLPLIRHYTLEKQEHFLCISLNGAQEVMNIRTVSVGILNRTLIHPREVFAEPLKERAAAVILSHNHPSGNSAPSDNDIDITKRLFKAANILGIHVLDHIIVTPADYFSFMENGLVFQRQIE